MVDRRSWPGGPSPSGPLGAAVPELPPGIVDVVGTVDDGSVVVVVDFDPLPGCAGALVVVVFDVDVVDP